MDTNSLILTNEKVTIALCHIKLSVLYMFLERHYVARFTNKSLFPHLQGHFRAPKFVKFDQKFGINAWLLMDKESLMLT